MGEKNLPEFDPGAPWIGPPGEEQRAPGAEITPPGPEITPPGPEFGQGGGEAAPQRPRKRSKRYLAAVAAVLLGLLGAGRTVGQPGPSLETRPPVQTEATEPSAGPTGEPTAPPPPPETEAPTQPPVQAEAVHVSVYPGYLLPGQEQEAVLLDETYSWAAFTGITIPQPEAQAGYRFLGYALIHRDLRDEWLSLPVGDALSRGTAAACRPDDTGTIQIRILGVWTAEGGERSFLPLTLDAGAAGSAQYDASGPMLSGTTVYLAAYPVPERPGWRFTGWYREPESGEPVLWLQASAFYAQRDGETDWRTQTPVTLYAHWTPGP